MFLILRMNVLYLMGIAYSNKNIFIRRYEMTIPEIIIINYKNCYDELIIVKVQFSPDGFEGDYVNDSIRFLKKFQAYLNLRSGLFDTDFLFRLMPIGIIEKKRVDGNDDHFTVIARSCGYKSLKGEMKRLV